MQTHDIKLSMEVSIGFVLSDLRNDASPGVKARAVDGISSQSLKLDCSPRTMNEVERVGIQTGWA